MQVITENKLVPKLRFGEFDSEWKQTALGNTSEIIGGGTPETVKPEYWGGMIQWFTPSELKQKYVSKSKRTITDIGLKKSSAKILPKGTLLFSSRATVGEVAIALNECCTNQGFQSFVVNSLNNSEFLYNWIIENKNKFIKLSSGSTFLEISKKEIVKIKLHLPSLPEQQKIASFLSAVDDKLQQLTKKKDLLEEYKKGVMQKIFSQELRFKDDNGNNYPDWEIQKIQKLLNEGVIISHLDGNHGALYPKSEEFTKEGVPYVTANDFIGGFVDINGCRCLPEDRAKQFKKGIARNGDVLFAHNATVGPTAILQTQLDYVILSTTATYYRCNIEKLDNKFLVKVFESNFFVKQYSRVMSQSTRNQVPITMQRTFFIPLPHLPEQQKIANFLSALDVKIELVITQIVNTQSFKKGLLQQMFVAA